MADVVEALIIDLLEWIASKERTYEEVMEAWRTSCPRLPVWEDANDRGLLAIEVVDSRSLVRLTPSGVALLESRTLHLSAAPVGGLATAQRPQCLMGAT